MIIVQSKKNIKTSRWKYIFHRAIHRRWFTFDLVFPDHVLAEVTDVCRGPIAHAARVRLLSLVSAHVGVTD